MVYPSKRVALRGLVLLVTAAVLGLGLAIPGQVAAVDRGPVRVAPRTLPPTSALAVIRTITLGGTDSQQPRVARTRRAPRMTRSTSRRTTPKSLRLTRSPWSR